MIKFRSVSAITSDRSTTNEEFFHAFQLLFYGQRMRSNVGGSNIETEPRFLQAYKEYEASGNVNTEKARFNYIPQIAYFAKMAKVNGQIPQFYILDYVSVVTEFRNYWIQNNGPAKYKEPQIFQGPDAAMYIINKVRGSGGTSIKQEEDDQLEIQFIYRGPVKKKEK